MALPVGSEHFTEVWNGRRKLMRVVARDIVGMKKAVNKLKERLFHGIVSRNCEARCEGKGE